MGWQEMTEYIDILLLENGVFCKAPSCNVDEGDLVSIPSALTGEQVILKVIATAWADPQSDTVKMIEKYIGFELPKITQKFKVADVVWRGKDEAVSE